MNSDDENGGKRISKTAAVLADSKLVRGARAWREVASGAEEIGSFSDQMASVAEGLADLRGKGPDTHGRRGVPRLRGHERFGNVTPIG